MSLQYTTSSMAVGNSAFGLAANATVELWGATFTEDRFVLALVKSGGAMHWRKIDSYQLSVVASEIAYAPSVAGIEPTDHAGPGQFLYVEGDRIFYHNGTAILRRAIVGGSDDGSFVPRREDGTALAEADVDAIVVKGSNVYVASKSNNKIYRYDISAHPMNGTNMNPTSNVTVAELATDEVCGLFIQTGGTDVVILLKGGAKRAVKFTDVLVRKGYTEWTDPSANIRAAQFRGSVLYLFANDPTVASTGVHMHRFGDASTDIVAKERTVISLSKERVKAGSDDIVTVTFTVKDGYGLSFPVSEKVRFSLVKIGDAFDKNDGGLSLVENATYRDSLGNPISTQLDVNFNAQGQAIVYWQAPKEVPIEMLYHRIRIKYPIFD